VTAAYQAEATEVVDATPAMTQPSIVAQRGTAFIPFSFEVGQDWNSIVNELGRLLADGRDVLDTTKMLTGTGTNEPGGILNIGGTGGLTSRPSPAMASPPSRPSSAGTPAASRRRGRS
jgi:HK97 family phage major capsid protein